MNIELEEVVVQDVTDQDVSDDALELAAGGGQAEAYYTRVPAICSGVIC